MLLLTLHLYTPPLSPVTHSLELYFHEDPATLVLSSVVMGWGQCKQL